MKFSCCVLLINLYLNILALTTTYKTLGTVRLTTRGTIFTNEALCEVTNGDC